MARRTFAAEDDRAVDFVDFAWTLHRDDAHWIPPLQMKQLDELTGASPFFRAGQLQMFLCEDGGRIVGRAAALLNARLPHEGQIGYFESVDEDKVAGSLFRAAGEWLRERGAQQLIGPMNGGMHRAHRLMTHGFDTAPFLFEPRTPAYYPRLFEAHGFVAMQRWHSYDVDLAGIEALRGRLHRLLERGGHDHGDVVIDVADGLEAESLKTRVYELLSGFGLPEVTHARATRDEWEEVFGDLVGLLGPRNLVLLNDRSGATRAFAFLYPDYSREVHALRGDDAAWGRWSRFPQSRRAVIHAATAAPGLHEDAILMVLEQAAAIALEDGYEHMVFAPLVSEPRFFRGIAEPDREYALYGRPL